MSDGKDQVRVELTFHKKQNRRIFKKRADSRGQPTPFAGAQAQDDRLTNDVHQYALYREGGDTTYADSTRQCITYYHARPHAEDSIDHYQTDPPSTTQDSPPKKKTRIYSLPSTTRDLSEPLIFYFFDAFDSRTLSMRYMIFKKSTASRREPSTSWLLTLNVSNVQLRRSTWIYQSTS